MNNYPPNMDMSRVEEAPCSECDEYDIRCACKPKVTPGEGMQEALKNIKQGLENLRELGI